MLRKRKLATNLSVASLQVNKATWEHLGLRVVDFGSFCVHRQTRLSLYREGTVSPNGGGIKTPRGATGRTGLVRTRLRKINIGVTHSSTDNTGLHDELLVFTSVSLKYTAREATGGGSTFSAQQASSNGEGGDPWVADGRHRAARRWGMIGFLAVRRLFSRQMWV